MNFIIEGTDRRGSLERQQAARPAHWQRLRELQHEGRSLLAGPIPAIDGPDPGPADFIGSLIVAQLDSRASAERWPELDSYVTADVYGSATVEPSCKVLP
jgi:uncharacterized protein YciI